jgi:hypothetical protein
MSDDTEQRLREALLSQSFSPEELAALSRDAIRILASLPYAPMASPMRRDPGALSPSYQAALADLLVELAGATPYITPGRRKKKGRFFSGPGPASAAPRREGRRRSEGADGESEPG